MLEIREVKGILKTRVTAKDRGFEKHYQSQSIVKKIIEDKPDNKEISGEHKEIVTQEPSGMQNPITKHSQIVNH